MVQSWSSFHAVRRRFLQVAGGVFVAPLAVAVPAKSSASDGFPPQIPGFPEWSTDAWRSLSKNDWKARLSPAAFRVLRKDGTETAFTSPLNREKRDGWYGCAGCGLILFSSQHKYDSGTGWPSFFQAIDGRTETSVDFKLIYPRTEYHCIRCRGHQGHIFPDGPRPTGERWCNNGVSIVFVTKQEMIEHAG